MPGGPKEAELLEPFMAMGLARLARLISNWAAGCPCVPGAQAPNEASPEGWCWLTRFLKSTNAR